MVRSAISDSFRGIRRLLHRGGMGLLRPKSELRIPPGKAEANRCQLSGVPLPSFSSPIGNDCTMSRPSLKISRHDNRPPPNHIAFEVWNPITAIYEPVASLDAGLFRVGELVEQVRVMWVQRDPAVASLKDAPDPAEDDDGEWAEMRVSAQANRVYETRSFDQTAWKKAMSRSAVIETICNEVGYARQSG